MKYEDESDMGPTLQVTTLIRYNNNLGKSLLFTALRLGQFTAVRLGQFTAVRRRQLTSDHLYTFSLVVTQAMH